MLSHWLMGTLATNKAQLARSASLRLKKAFCKKNYQKRRRTLLAQTKKNSLIYSDSNL